MSRFQLDIEWSWFYHRKSLWTRKFNRIESFNSNGMSIQSPWKWPPLQHANKSNLFPIGWTVKSSRMFTILLLLFSCHFVYVGRIMAAVECARSIQLIRFDLSSSLLTLVLLIVTIRLKRLWSSVRIWTAVCVALHQNGRFQSVATLQEGQCRETTSESTEIGVFLIWNCSEIALKVLSDVMVAV